MQDLSLVSPFRPGVGAGTHVKLLTSTELNGALGVVESAGSGERVIVRLAAGGRRSIRRDSLEIVAAYQPFGPMVLDAIESEGDLSAVATWLASGGDANAPFSALGAVGMVMMQRYAGATPLMVACGSGAFRKVGPTRMEPVVKMLLDHRADPNKAAPDGCTAFVAACQQAGNFPICALLLKYGADVDAMSPPGAVAPNSQSALVTAGLARNAPGVFLLLRAGCDLHLADSEIADAMAMLTPRAPKGKVLPPLPPGMRESIARSSKAFLWDSIVLHKKEGLKRTASLGVDSAWLYRAVRNVRLIDPSDEHADGWSALRAFVVREGLMLGGLMHWQPPGPPRWPEAAYAQPGLSTSQRAELNAGPPPCELIWHDRMPQAVRHQILSYLSRPLLIYHACWMQLGDSLYRRTEPITLHFLGWASVASTAGFEFDQAGTHKEIGECWAPTLRRLFPLVESFHLCGFGPEAPRHEASFLDGWLRLSLCPGLYEVSAHDVPTVTIAPLPAIWDAVWPEEGGTVRFSGGDVDRAKLRRAATSAFSEHVMHTSEHDMHGHRTVPFAALWRPTFEALRDAGRPVLLTHNDSVEEQLSVQNLRALAGDATTLLHTSRNPYPNPGGVRVGNKYSAAVTRRLRIEADPSMGGADLEGIERVKANVVEMDIRKHPFNKYVDDPSWFLDVDEVQSGKMRVGMDVRLLWFQG